jgi:hypothetical protein
MSESADYTATSWVPSHDYKDARATYTSSVVDRSYSKAAAARVAPKELVKTGIKLETPTLIVVTDVTGSMGQWPAVMFGKLPYLMHELKVYLGDKAKLLMAAIGDATCDSYPLQIQEPKETFDEAKGSLEALVVEGGGGGQTTESYELAAGYFLKAVDVARDVKPVLVFIGDENPYPSLSASQLSALGVSDAENMSTENLFKELNNVYDVYLIHKPYGNTMSGITQEVKANWLRLLPPQHLVPLDQPERVVDVLFGILAGATDKVDDFKKELTDRQTPAQVTTVLTALHDLYATTASSKKLRSGKSTMHKLPSGKPSKPLL